ncbi:GDSL-type esterase/lipase family protein [Clostridium sp. SHJSY1]|uniref:GDSL-type esterase/lipase family protein n=1 Tax=Clostridium sp. SHJSY1 TaxID=2942483 RepID=UPI002876F1CD|nr:GDSL-type esterase/lipase family protein [Clostridium sp. SHJSY1]MDS0528108.1 GDSL-type esterase/lipase family protein [Clostridium sp. SHJSY1]
MNKKIVLLGDSLTFGYGVTKKDSWAYNLSKHLSLEIINKGINGDTTASMLDRFYEDVSSLNPDYVFVMGGSNDLLCGRTPSSIVANIEEIIKDYSSKNIIVGIPPCIIKEMAERLFMPSSLYTYLESSLPLLRKKIINLCNTYSIKYIDFYSLTLNNIEKNIFVDGIHLNSLGNNLMLTEILNVLTI